MFSSGLCSSQAQLSVPSAALMVALCSVCCLYGFFILIRWGPMKAFMLHLFLLQLSFPTHVATCCPAELDRTLATMNCM